MVIRLLENALLLLAVEEEALIHMIIDNGPRLPIPQITSTCPQTTKPPRWATIHKLWLSVFSAFWTTVFDPKSDLTEAFA